MTNVEKIQNLFLETLSDKFPHMTKENIQVRESYDEADYDDYKKALREKTLPLDSMSKRYFHSVENTTFINFNDIKIDLKTIEALTKAVRNITGVWCSIRELSFDRSGIIFEAHSERLVNNVSAQQLKTKLTKRMVNPLLN